MCAICDGTDPDDLLDDMRRRVDWLGWTLVGVEPSHRGPGWVYSAGLTASFDHPEVHGSVITESAMVTGILTR